MISWATRRATSFQADLLLRAEELGGVFEHEDVAEVLAVREWPVPHAFEQGDGGGELKRGRRWRLHLHLGGGGAHAVGAAEEAVEGFDDLGGKDVVEARPTKWRWPPGSSISEKARLARTMRRSAESVTTPLGMVSMMVSSSVRRAWRAALSSESCAVECSAVACGAFEVGGHGVEAGDEFAELFGGGLADAVGVVAGGDGFHGVGERFDRARDLLGEIEREPAAGEEREAGGEQEQSHVEVADLAALAEERPVGVGGRCAGGAMVAEMPAGMGRPTTTRPPCLGRRWRGCSRCRRGCRRGRRCAGRPGGWPARWGLGAAVLRWRCGRLVGVRRRWDRLRAGMERELRPCRRACGTCREATGLPSR